MTIQRNKKQTLSRKQRKRNKRNEQKAVSLAQSVLPTPVVFPICTQKGRTLFFQEQRRSRVSGLLGPAGKSRSGNTKKKNKKEDRKRDEEKSQVMSSGRRTKSQPIFHATQLFQYPPSNLSTCLWPIASSHASCNTPPSSPSGNCAPGVNSRQMLWGSSWRSRSGA